MNTERAKSVCAGELVSGRFLTADVLQSVEETERDKLRRARGSAAVAGVHE
jgi:hypothetical protein